jgi:hypothetical protein
MDNQIRNKFIGLIKNIGLKGVCTGEELKQILPEFPVLKGSEFIFSINHSNAKNYIDDDIELLVKGLHLVELKYIELTHNNFGFGSASPTSKVIEALTKKDMSLATKLKSWVSVNGGNYYIKRKQNDTTSRI